MFAGETEPLTLAVLRGLSGAKSQSTRALGGMPVSLGAEIKSDPCQDNIPLISAASADESPFATFFLRLDGDARRDGRIVAKSPEGALYRPAIAALSIRRQP